MEQIFISYKAEDFNEANQLKQTIEKNGISCWMAPLSLSGGSSYAAEIPKAIRNCRVFLLFFSEKTQSSKWIPRELDQAINENKIIMPFMTENFALNDDFSFYLSNVQRYFAYENKELATEKLIADIKSVLGINATPAEKEKNDVKTGSAVQPVHKTQKKTAKTKAVTDKNAIKKNGLLKNRKAVFCSLFVIIFAVFALSVCISVFSKITIAGIKFKKNTFSVELCDTQLENEDLIKLSKLKNLDSIKITDTDLSFLDFSLLNNDSIYSLTIEDSGLTEQQIQLIHLENVSRVSFADNGITDLSEIKFSDNLISLNLSGNMISDLSSLANYVKLETLNISNCGITSLKALETCLCLKEIDVSRNKLENLDGLENATLLENVVISENNISDISVLKKSSETLKRLIADNNSLTSLYGIEDCKLLRYLNVNNNILYSLKELSEINGLIDFSAANNNIASLEGIENNTGIKYLNLSNNVIEDITPLSLTEEPESYQSVALILSDNKISELSLPNVSYSLLAIQNNKTEDDSLNGEFKCKNFVFDYNSYIDFSVLKEKEISCWIIGCPLDKQISIKNTLGDYYTHYVTEKETADLINSYFPDGLVTEL